jgi:ectoine hydroxylase-related dioxygenase (phytanoyl-CoA dioxygenase family)
MLAQDRAHRRDLKLQLAPPVTAALHDLLGAVGGCLADILTRDAVLCELSALVADPGAAAQLLHPDTQMAPGNDYTGLCTAFLALQDVTGAMGPTEICPRSHGAEAHAALSADLGLATSPRSGDCWGKVSAVQYGHCDHIIRAPVIEVSDGE